MIHFVLVGLAVGLVGAAFVYPAEVAVFVAAALAAEVGARAWHRLRERQGRTDPGALVQGVLDHGGELHRIDESLGSVLVPGVDLVGRVRISGRPDHTYRVRTDAAGCRRTAEDDRHAGRPVVAVFGCSWAFGTALSDEDTFPWQLQTAMPDYEVKNYGVGGHSLYQTLLRLEQTIARDRPAAVVVVYLPSHDSRSVGALGEIPWFAAPSCRANSDGTGLIRLPSRRTSSLTRFKHSYFLRAVGRATDRIRAGDTSPEVQRRTTEALFLAIRRVCNQAGAKLFIASFQHGNRHATFLQSEGFYWNGLELDVCEPDRSGTYRFLLLPYDNHPNRLANRLFSQIVQEALALLLGGKHVRVNPDYFMANACKVEVPAHLNNTYPLS